ncbi:hypothetical protein MMC07_007901 [Pseudocyphellaria aurata]|nr:hypothetical protein [Pseudocyphellaria aurata]
MGANQSSSTNSSSDPKNAAGNHRPEMKTCYYELLGIERQASDEQIKKAYRKKALELHPDRNYGNVEETTRLFAELQSAYAVLSDPQERAWYDSHRNAILRDESNLSENHYEHNIRVTTSEYILRLFSRFDGRMDFSDTPFGFYKTFSDTFDRLAREEELACEWEGLDQVSYPDFGRAGDDYETAVRPFYVAWTAFMTKKTFSWKEVYRYSEAPDRRTRRFMERENKRLREEAIYEYNDSVRSLVAFLKKRDPRFKPNIQSEAERQKTLRNAAMAQAARSRAANQARSHQPAEFPEWIKMKESIEDDTIDEKQEVIQEQVECIVCQKIFKSVKQYEAHEKSKKHIKASKYICSEMENDIKALHLHEDTSNDLTQPCEHGAASISDEHALTEIEDLATKGHEHLADFTECKSSTDGSTNYPDNGIDGSASTDRDAEKPTNKDPRSSFADDHFTTRRLVEDPLLNEVKPAPIVHTTLSDINDVVERFATETIVECNDDRIQPKVGKAKQKRARKATQQITTNKRSGTNVSRYTHIRV